jgi:hypothetical protein
MLLPASVADNVMTCHSAEHPCGASALRELPYAPVGPTAIVTILARSSKQRLEAIGR